MSLGLIGSLVGGLANSFLNRQGKAQQRDGSQNASIRTPQDRISQSAQGTEKETTKSKATALLALKKTGSGGVLNEAATGRRKLLGN